MNGKHRLPRRHFGAALIALALVVGAFSWSWAATGADADADANLSPIQLAQAQKANCQLLAAKATSSAQRTRAQQCVADQQRIIDLLTAPTQSPSGSPTGSPPPTATPTPTVTPTTPVPTTPVPTTTSPTPTPTQTPTGWPGAGNTGYRNAPGYPGSLTVWNGQALQSGQTYRFIQFPVGFHVDHLTNVVFYGCRFPGLDSTDSLANVHIFGGDNITFDYSSFEPLTARPPVAHTASSQFGLREWPLDVPGKVTVDHSDFWGFGNAIGFAGDGGHSTQAAPFTVRNSWIHDARADGTVRQSNGDVVCTDPDGCDHTDGILNNVNNPSSGNWIYIQHNTIVSAGNTNGIALQDTQGDAHVWITGNYLSGWGIPIQAGGPSNVDVHVTDNVLGSDLQWIWRPVYGWWGGNGNEWARNRIHFVPGSHVFMDGGNSARLIVAGDEGRFWLPDGTISTVDFTG